MSNRAYEKAIEDYNDEHRFDDKEIVEYWIGVTKFRNYDSAVDYCNSNGFGYSISRIKKVTCKVDWQGNKL